MRWKSGEKAGIYTSSMPLFFGFSFFFEKRTCIFFRKLNGSKTPKKTDNYALPPLFFWLFLFLWKKRKRADEKGCAVMCKYKGWKGKRRGRNGEKAGIYAYWTLSAFWLSFFFEKKNTSTLSAHLLRRSLCAYMGTERKRQKQRKNNILLWFFLFPWKKNVCIFIHVLHHGKYVHTWGWKKKWKGWGKVVILLLFFFFLCKKICASLYTSPHTGYMCIHGERKGETELAKKQITALFRGHHSLVLLFPLQ